MFHFIDGVQLPQGCRAITKREFTYPLCGCGNDVEFTDHFLLHYFQFVNERHILLSPLGNFTQTLIFGNMSLNPSDNSKILNAT